MLLHYIYILILTYLTAILGIEFITEKNWKLQAGIAIVILIFILRIFHIK